MAAQNPQQAIAVNQQMRAALLATSPRQRKNLGSFSSPSSGVNALGTTTRIKLYNVGIITRLIMQVTVSIDIATTAGVLSPKAPFNLISRVRLTDFDGTDRVNIDGYQLFVVNCNRYKTYYGYDNNVLSPQVPESTGATNYIPISVQTLPSVPTAIATGKFLSFFLEIPLAYDPEKDLRGAILAQTAIGEMYLNIDWNGVLLSANNADAVYTQATGTAVITAGTFINTNVWQEYLLPQSLGGQVPLPQLDLLTVYELAGNLRSTDNLIANSEKLINYPNVRSVIGAYVYFVNNGVMNSCTAYDTTGTPNAAADIKQFRIIANGNNVLWDNLPDGQLFEQRLYNGGDIRPGTYYWNSRNKPVETALYGNVQIGITPSVVTVGNTYMAIAFESFYTKGATLPGLSQASG